MDISVTLGTSKVVFNVIEHLEENPNCEIQIVGDAGRGKTWIGDQIEEHLSYKSFVSIHLFGDGTKIKEPFYPFGNFIEKSDRKYNKGITAFKESISAIPYVGKGIKVLVDDYNFRNTSLKRTLDQLEPFKWHLAFSLHLTGLIKKYKGIVIIADDAHLLDEETIKYFSLLHSGLRELDLLGNISYVFLTDQSSPILLGGNKKVTINLPVLTQDQAKAVMTYWSNKPLSDEDMDTILSCTGTHLQLIKIASHYIRETDPGDIDKKFKNLLIGFIDSRLKSAKIHYERLKQLIISINQAGKRTSSTELLCLLDNQNDVNELIERAVEMDLLTIKDGYIHFSHSVVEEYVLSLKSSRSYDFYDKLTSCIRKISPSSYERRAVIASLGRKINEADVFWALACIQKFQQGDIQAGLALREKISDSFEGNEIKLVLEQFAACYTYSFQGLIDEAIAEIEGVPNTLPKLILAERFYLKCLNLAKRISNAAKLETLSITDDWEDLKDEEPDIWYRFSQVKIIAASELGEFDLALKTEAAIMKYYSSRLNIDINARKVLDRLNLFAEVLYTPEIAHKKMLQTEARLTKAVINDHYDRLVDLYISRTNLSSNCFMIDEFEKSFRIASDSISLLTEFPEINFPYPEASHNNYYLSLFFSDNAQLPFVLEQYELLMEKVQRQENKILVTINYAGFQVFNNDPHGALATLKSGIYIPVIHEDDWYYCYYYWINYALVCYLCNDQSSASAAIDGLKYEAKSVSHFLERYYQMHYQLISEIVLSPDSMTITEVQLWINKRKPIFSSKIWERFKAGYLFTDLQIWTSS